jgi:hypothetical protein
MEPLDLFFSAWNKYGWIKALTIALAINSIMMIIEKIRHFWRKAKGKFVGYKDLDIKLSNAHKEIEEMKKEFQRKCDHEKDEREILATNINTVRNLIIDVRVKLNEMNDKKNG